MGDTIRWGIVGTGMMAIEHIANLQLTPGSVITALVDPEPASIARAEAAVGGDVRVFASPADLAASGTVDAVLVASPNFTHHDVLQPLIDARLNILCEKPLATTFADAADIARRGSRATTRCSGPAWNIASCRRRPSSSRRSMAARSGR